MILWLRKFYIRYGVDVWCNVRNVITTQESYLLLFANYLLPFVTRMLSLRVHTYIYFSIPFSVQPWSYNVKSRKHYIIIIFSTSIIQHFERETRHSAPRRNKCRLSNCRVCISPPIGDTYTRGAYTVSAFSQTLLADLTKIW